MFVRVRYAGQKVSVQHKKKHSVYKSLETSGEYLRRKDPMHHVVLSSEADDSFVCSSCGVVSNESCRSFPSDGSTIFPGTNIDSSDFAFTAGDTKDIKCSKLKNPKFFKIETLINVESGEKGKVYDKVQSYYDKKKEVPIMVNFFAEKVLRKVYRFFPKYYAKVGGKWISTVMRVRTTQGNEKKFIFETLTHIQKKNGKLKLYLDFSADPDLKNVHPESLFSTD